MLEKYKLDALSPQVLDFQKLLKVVREIAYVSFLLPLCDLSFL